MERSALGDETWTRRFEGNAFQSIMSVGDDGQLHETFGPASIALGLRHTRKGLELPVMRAYLFGIPLPQVMLPISSAREYVDEQGRFRFDVRIDLPFFGLLAHYRGWLRPVCAAGE